LQVIEAALGQKSSEMEQRFTAIEQRFTGVEETLEQRFSTVEASLRHVTLQQEDWRNSLPLLADAHETGLLAVRPTARQWIPPAASQIFVAAGMRIRFVQDKEFLLQLESLLQGGGSVTLVMSDPRSTRVWDRYRDEPRGHLDGDALGVGNQMANLADLVRGLHEWRSLLDSQMKVDTHRLQIKISPLYPSAAYYLVDQSIHTYSYPYRFRGLESPVYSFSASGAVGVQLVKFLDRVVQDAVPLDDKEYADLKQRWEEGKLNDNVVLGRGP
jgi:hypothetical protein